MLKSKNITSKSFADDSVTQIESFTSKSSIKDESIIRKKSKYMLDMSFILREKLIYHINNEDK